MIKANRTWLGVNFFDLYASVQLKRNFKTVRFVGEYTPTNKPILLIANHFSWWDGFIQIVLNNRFFKKQYHVMMLEQQLQANMALNQLGAFSIKKNSRSAIESLNYSVDLLRKPNNLVMMFPQGEIQSIYTPRFVFEKGIRYILKPLGNDVQLIFNVNLIDYFSDKKPSLTIYFKVYPLPDTIDAATIESDFNMFANECMKKQIPQ